LRALKSVPNGVSRGFGTIGTLRLVQNVSDMGGYSIETDRKYQRNVLVRPPDSKQTQNLNLCAQMLGPFMLSAIRCRQFNRCVGPDDLSAVRAPIAATPQLHVDRGDRFLNSSERWGLIPKVCKESIEVIAP
jgi:hypothetical protein